MNNVIPFSLSLFASLELIVVDEDPDLAQVVSTPMDAQCVIEISNREFLLCFASELGTMPLKLSSYLFFSYEIAWIVTCL